MFEQTLFAWYVTIAPWLTPAVTAVCTWLLLTVRYSLDGITPMWLVIVSWIPALIAGCLTLFLLFDVVSNALNQ